MPLTVQELIQILQDFLQREVVFRMTFSDAKNRSAAQYHRKLNLRPFQSKQGRRWSLASWDGLQESHQTLDDDDLLDAERLSQYLTQFHQLQIYSPEGEYHIFSNRDGLRLLKRPAGQGGPKMSLGQHDRTKKYLLPEGKAIPFLVELGVMNASGKVVKARYDKFRQINRFLEIVADIYKELPSRGVLRVIDFGCGRSYLTFALHWLFTNHFRREVNITGLDLKQEVVASCNVLQQKLVLPGLSFAVGDIAAWRMEEPVDLVVALHACDTATDAALAQAVRWQSRVILAAPCCQHQLAPQLTAAPQQALLRHGIFRERLGALLTDALRAAALEALGWSCQALEFVDLEHTPKNLLLRAVFKSSAENENAALAYRELRSAWGIREFALEELLDSETRQRLGI